MLQGHFKDLLTVVQGSFKEISRMSQGVIRKFPGLLKENSKLRYFIKVQVMMPGNLHAIQGCFKELFRLSQCSNIRNFGE